jgi:hypothetical protein
MMMLMLSVLSVLCCYGIACCCYCVLMLLLLRVDVVRSFVPCLLAIVVFFDIPILNYNVLFFFFFGPSYGRDDIIFSSDDSNYFTYNLFSSTDRLVSTSSAAADKSTDR